MKALTTRLEIVRGYLSEGPPPSREMAMECLKEAQAISEAIEAALPLVPRGCICPAGAEKGCAAPLCPRSAIL